MFANDAVLLIGVYVLGESLLDSKASVAGRESLLYPQVVAPNLFRKKQWPPAPLEFCGSGGAIQWGLNLPAAHVIFPRISMLTDGCVRSRSQGVAGVS